ncbi:hypothetical protein B0A55_11969 [Friedmanniomyces simplex]|uniref:Uncharacterized protein n=1 Tax=Friedmanniomyces simplex TaxID=329884 RepID=A0A4U0WJV4_9PEZI|nr:hypothetical protein B0A55_11969 [Friedmanniomyces simplex]
MDQATTRLPSSTLSFPARIYMLDLSQPAHTTAPVPSPTRRHDSDHAAHSTRTARSPPDAATSWNITVNVDAPRAVQKYRLVERSLLHRLRHASLTFNDHRRDSGIRDIFHLLKGIVAPTRSTPSFKIDLDFDGDAFGDDAGLPPLHEATYPSVEFISRIEELVDTHFEQPAQSRSTTFSSSPAMPRHGPLAARVIVRQH